MSDFHVPTTLYHGGNDWLADPTDVKLLVDELPKGVVKSIKFIPDWMHLDFIWGIDAPKMVYNDLIRDALEDFEQTQIKESLD